MVVRDKIAGAVGKNSKQRIFGARQFNLIPIYRVTRAGE
jgi:hypothetical protein